MTVIKIESNIPMPGARRGLRREATVADSMRKMLVGDPFVIDAASGVHALMHSYARRAGITVSVRVISQDRVRVWRVAERQTKAGGEPQLKSVA